MWWYLYSNLPLIHSTIMSRQSQFPLRCLVSHEVMRSLDSLCKKTAVSSTKVVSLGKSASMALLTRPLMVPHAKSCGRPVSRNSIAPRTNAPATGEYTAETTVVATYVTTDFTIPPRVSPKTFLKIPRVEWIRLHFSSWHHAVSSNGGIRSCWVLWQVAKHDPITLLLMSW